MLVPVIVLCCLSSLPSRSASLSTCAAHRCVQHYTRFTAHNSLSKVAAASKLLNAPVLCTLLPPRSPVVLPGSLPTPRSLLLWLRLSPSSPCPLLSASGKHKPLSYVVRLLGLSICSSTSHSHSHALTITCTCCYDEIKGIQDQDLFTCSFSDSLCPRPSLSASSPQLILCGVQQARSCVAPAMFAHGA